ncbi:MAG: glycosyltransferase, partial [Myxococcota bacterium]
MEAPAPELSVVLPCHNELENLEPLLTRLQGVLERLTVGRYEVIFVDDASSDGSERKLDELHQRDPRIKVVHFSRNFGHQAALSAGMQLSSGA